MTSPANYFREIADSCRAIPGEFGLREHAVYIRITTWGGPSFGEGNFSCRDTQILVGGQNPKVRMPSQKEIMLGAMGKGDIKVGPFTPDFGAAGLDRELILNPERSRLTEWNYLVTGPAFPKGMLFRQMNTNVDRALQITVTMSPVSGPA